MVNSGTESGEVIIKVACKARAGQTLPKEAGCFAVINRDAMSISSCAMFYFSLINLEQPQTTLRSSLSVCKPERPHQILSSTTTKKGSIDSWRAC